MARFETDGLARLAVDYEELEHLPSNLLEDMLNAGAAVLERAQKAKGREYGVYRTGMTIGSIKRGKVKTTADGRAIYIYPQGKNKQGNRNADVAFINEFGKKGQTARPFIRGANESAAEETISKAEKVYDEWLKSKNF